MPMIKPDLAAAFDVVSDQIEEAARLASQRLSELGIRHALVGGLAIGAHGWPRGTKDVDFVVGMEAYNQSPSGIITAVAGLPINIRGVAIDNIPAEDSATEEALRTAEISEGIPVAPAEAVVFMKLKSPRPKDKLDIMELLLSGLDAEDVRSWLRDHGASEPMIEKFERIVDDADEAERQRS